ncbi:MAG: A/G-specific adenine glycosylase [Myxococcota bacterium]
MTDRSPAPELAASIVRWFGRVARDLPWRRDPTPYHVLLSELMLQQTRVETVIPYFERFVARWPTLEALAAAPLDDVLTEWAGLGYYARARNLVRCAIAATERGGLPQDPDGLRTLPGIGPYTAGAIASIAFGAATPLVDGNVERVLCRLDGIEDDPRSTGRAAVWARAAELVAARPADAHPGALNQGLMELGATVCTPRAPKCGACPVADGCVARATGEPERLPNKAAKPSPRPMRGVSGIVRADGGFLLGQRPPGLLGGMWEPIGCHWDPDRPGGGDEPVATDRLRDAFRDRVGVELVTATPLGSVEHLFTHRHLTCTVFTAAIRGTPRILDHYTDVRWVTDLRAVAVSTLARRVLGLYPDPDAAQGGLPFAAEPNPGRSE